MQPKNQIKKKTIFNFHTADNKRINHPAALALRGTSKHADVLIF